MLIDREEQRRNLSELRLPSPVTGSVNDYVPTTGDVHLYADPASYYTQRPVLFADCEGLNGGEQVPRGVAAKEQYKGPLKRKLRKGGGHSYQKDLEWAVDPKTQRREYAIMELYPRLLYTFSDVVVFVLKEVRYDSQSVPI